LHPLDNNRFEILRTHDRAAAPSTQSSPFIDQACIGYEVFPRGTNASNPHRVSKLRSDEFLCMVCGHPPQARGMLKHAVTSRAVSKIKAWIKTEERNKSIALGRDILEKEFRKHKLSLGQILKADDLEKICEEYSIADTDDLMALIGYGKISARQIVNRYLPEEEEKKEESLPEKLWKKLRKPETTGVSITGIDDVMVRFGKCCDPLPGDEIVGYISRAGG